MPVQPIVSSAADTIANFVRLSTHCPLTSTVLMGQVRSSAAASERAPRSPAWTRWDSLVAQRAFGATALLVVISIIVTAASDEGGVAWRERITRSVPAWPLACAGGVAIVIARARRRGETRALESLGATPRRIRRPATMGGVFGVLAALGVAAAMAVPLGSLYPQPPADLGLEPEGDAFVSVAAGRRVEADGTVVDLDPKARGGTAPSGVEPSPLAIWTTLVMATVAMGIVAAHPWGRPAAFRLAILGIAVLASLLGFQLAAAGRATAWIGSIPMLLYAGFVLAMERAPERRPVEQDRA